MIYGTPQPGILITLICILIVWSIYRHDKRKQREQEDNKRRREEEIRRRAEESRKKNAELFEECERIRRSGMNSEILFLTEDEVRKKGTYEAERGTSAATKEIIEAAWNYLHGIDRDKIDYIRSRMSERRARSCQVAIAMDKEDAERMKYCRCAAAMKVDEIYILGLEICQSQME